MKNYFQLFLFFWMLGNPLVIVAQKVTFSYVNLPTNSDVIWITDLKQDSQGCIWMASFTGLHRYNGYEWKSFFHNPKVVNGDDNYLESVCPTRDGLVWVGTQGLGLDCLDPESGHIRHYFLAHRQKLNKLENFVSVLYEGRDGTLWIGTYNGLYARNPKTGRITHYPHNPQDAKSLSHNQVRSICEDHSGAIWIGTGEPTETTPKEGGLNKLDRRTGFFTQYLHDPANPNSLSDNRVRTIMEDKRGTLWVGTWGDGLNTMDPQTGKFTRHLYNPAHPEQLSRPYLKNHKGEANWGISFIKEDSTGNIWIGAYAGGLNRYNPQTGQLTHYDAVQGGVENNQWSMCISRDGVLWLGSAGNKLMKGIPSIEPVPFFGTISTIGINAFHEYAPGAFLLGTYRGLKSHTFGGKPDAILQQAAIQTTLLTDGIQSFYEDRQGDCWISTINAGLYRYTSHRGQFTNYLRDSIYLSSNLTSITYLGVQSNAVIKQLEEANSVMASYEDRAGTFWVMTGHGLNRMNRQTGQITAFRHNPRDSTTISRGVSTCALEDHTGQFWVGTASGLNRMDRQKGTFTHYLTGNYIAQIHEDASGTLWILTLGNLYHFDRQQNKFKLFLNPNTGQPLTNTDNLVEDDAQNLWVGTTTGLIRINRQRDSLHVFNADYGFRGYSSIQIASVHKSHDGSLLFGGENGYYRFRPERLMAKLLALPPLRISTFFIVNQPVGPHLDGPLRESLAQAKTIHLAHNQNTFAFDFAALEYRHPDQVQYAYFLENYEPTWRPTGSERRGSYYNMPPGNYVFRVKAGNNEAGWTERSIAVIISPPWWQTWWAYILFALLAIGAIWVIIQYRSRTLRRENRRLEEKVSLRTEQLQQSLTQLKTTQNQLIQKEKLASLGELTAGIAHEIQNPLNFVNNFAEVSVELADELHQSVEEDDKPLSQELATDLRQNMTQIVQNGQRASNIVRAMLEHSQATTGERQPIQLNGLAEEYLRLAYHGFRAKDSLFTATLNTDFQADLPPLEGVVQDLSRVLLNLYNNAFYALRQRLSLENQQDPVAYEPTLWVSTRLVAGQSDRPVVELRVKDNGVGIPARIQEKVFQPFFTTKPTGQGTGLGLSLSYDIITKGHGGEMALESQEGRGTEFIISLPV